MVDLTTSRGPVDCCYISSLDFAGGSLDIGSCLGICILTGGCSPSTRFVILRTDNLGILQRTECSGILEVRNRTDERVQYCLLFYVVVAFE